MTSWLLVVALSADRSLSLLPERFAAVVVEFMLSPLVENPHRVGKPLARELAGYHAARRGPYRIVYRIDGQLRRIEVVRIDHRAMVYRSH